MFATPKWTTFRLMRPFEHTVHWRKGGPPRGCLMCSMTVYASGAADLEPGQAKQKLRTKQGHRVRSECSLCKVPLCTRAHDSAHMSCFKLWHATHKLEKRRG